MRSSFFRTSISIAALASLMLGAPSFAEGSSASLGLHERPCAIGKANLRASCGTFGVFENRASQTGRILALHFVLLQSVHPPKGTILFAPGGPGQSGTSFAPIVADQHFERPLYELRSDYNILFVDNRGMGDSNPFACNFTPPSDPNEIGRAHV